MTKLILWITTNKEVLVFAAIMFVIGVTAWQIDSCRTRNNEKKKEILKDAIREGKIEGNIQSNRITDAANNAEKANQNVNAVRNRSAIEYSNSFDEVKRKFCVEFPTDPICEK